MLSGGHLIWSRQSSSRVAWNTVEAGFVQELFKGSELGEAEAEECPAQEGPGFVEMDQERTARYSGSCL